VVAENDFLAATDKYGHQLIDAAKTLDLDIPVPTCPDWTVRNLVAHTAAVYQHKATTVADGWVDESPPWPEAVAQATGGDVVGVLEQSLDALLVVFTESDLSKPIYTWCDHEHTADWWVRRMAHESLIHAADAIIAGGGRPSAETWIALDGVDEILEEMMVGAPDWAVITLSDPRIDLRSGDRIWGLRVASWSGTGPTSGTVYAEEPAIVFDATGAADVTISTDSESLDYWMWGRADLPAGATVGDGKLVTYVRGVAAVATG
jgi:uncharacterized protein (TIGR03083 family)